MFKEGGVKGGTCILPSSHVVHVSQLGLAFNYIFCCPSPCLVASLIFLYGVLSLCAKMKYIVVTGGELNLERPARNGPSVNLWGKAGAVSISHV